MKVNITATCNGKGYWSRQPGRKVKIDMLFINYINNEKTFGELIAYFDQTTWNCNDHGLIYTDEGWLEDFKKELKNLGFSDQALSGISYSEQGMQSNEYISMDVEETFIKEFYKDV